MARDILQTALRGAAVANPGQPRRLHDFIPDVETFLRLEPEDLAGVVLAWLNPIIDKDATPFNRHFVTQETHLEGYESRDVPQLRRALMEAWVWLEREGFVAPHPDFQHYFITRRGRRVVTPQDMTAYRAASLLPKQCLHPLIVQKVSAPFLRGEYDTAVFQAFREVEVQVRAAGGFGPEARGVAMMRNAFNADGGPLTDATAEGGERQGVSDLFAGAVAVFKNPQSHRAVKVEVHEAVELLGFASFLLKTVDARVAAKATAALPAAALP
jgi:uncharacterized protein (TIGR02391 family)